MKAPGKPTVDGGPVMTVRNMGKSTALVVTVIDKSEKERQRAIRLL